MKRNSGQDALPWFVWLALAVDPMTAAVVLTTRPRPSRPPNEEQR
jgi:hypothetical protein